ncbi:MAG: hypothetical protein HWN66_14850 [Candidatus Helarchaeota archaeon]|nr:hypothetical protein [Candidatus Helarchaeota archaeon]
MNDNKKKDKRVRIALRHLYRSYKRYQHLRQRQLEVDVVHDYLESNLEDRYFKYISEVKKLEKTHLDKYWKTVDELIRLKKSKLIIKAKLPFMKREVSANYQRFLSILGSAKD